MVTDNIRCGKKIGIGLALSGRVRLISWLCSARTAHINCIHNKYTSTYECSINAKAYLSFTCDDPMLIWFIVWVLDYKQLTA